MKEPVLEFRRVGLHVPPEARVKLEDISFSCPPGGLWAIETCRLINPERLPLASAAQGLEKPRNGKVLFRGEDWVSMSPAAAAEARGAIGRVFPAPAWVSNLNVDENITLSQRHHTLRDPGEIAAAAAELAARFELEPPPPLRPPLLDGERLRRYEWVRAFLGSPVLIILENPLAGVYSDSSGRLLEKAVEEYRARGTGFLWIADEYRPLESALPEARFRLGAEGFIPAGTGEE